VPDAAHPPLAPPVSAAGRPRVVLGVAGGIAAYKACLLLRLLTEAGFPVRVVPTASALRFVGAATWAALSGAPVHSEVWDDAHEVPHVQLGRAADLVVVAPATADLLAKVAHGQADDLLTSTLLTARCPVLLAPAMHTEMWEHPATRANVATLRDRGVLVLEPASGRLTGPDTGPGRLPEPAEIFAVCRRLLARGAADDKGQVFFHTLGVRAHLAASGRSSPAVNLKLLVEGEEESGSPNFAALLREQRDRLRCDVVVVSDTGMWSRDTPTTCTGMRGLIDGQLDLRALTGDVHSGSFGGAIRNPLTELTRLLGSLHDEHGRVTIDGFYDDVVELTDTERALFAKLPYDEAEWLANARSTSAHGEAGFTTLERVWARPTAEVNGVWGGHTGAGGKTIVPAQAHAKISFRLVPRQDPADIQAKVRAWLERTVPGGVEWSLQWWGPGVRPCLTPLDHPALASVTRAMERAFGTGVLYTREGGSGPEADLQDVLEAPVVFLGISLPDDGWHAPNEKVEIPLLLKGAEAAAYLWDDLARTLPR